MDVHQFDRRLRETRMSSMERFLADFEAGKKEGRLCSHFFFLYSEQLAEDFHTAAIREMARVATEVRIFPLLALGAKRSNHVDTVCRRLSVQGFMVTTERVPYEFQRGGNEMMRVRPAP